MVEFNSAARYREDADRMKALAHAAATPAVRDEFLRIASMYEVLARSAAARIGLSAPGPYAGPE